jgi:glycosyltransferase involved in cell wall biosynthesis
MHLHVPTPGELVSPVSGSAVVSVARALGTAQIAAGGTASFIARRGMDHRPEPLGLIEAALPHKVWLSRSEKVFDLVAGPLSGRRPAAERLWAPIYDAIPDDHNGPVFLHNAPGAANGLRRRRPDSVRVVHLHNATMRGWPAATRRQLVKTHRVVCVSRYVAEGLMPGAADRGEVLALLNGTDVEQFRPVLGSSEPRVLFVGKVTPHKGPDLLIEAARLLFDDGLRFHLRIVGSSVLSGTDELSDFERSLRLRAAQLGEFVEFVPFVDRDRIADVYRDATIMVVPSNWDDPCPLTLPEAMAAGLACVASRRGGLPEAGGDAPLYFDPPDVQGLASCLRLLLTDEDERRARAAAARSRAEEITWGRQLQVLNAWLAHESRSHA